MPVSVKAVVFDAGGQVLLGLNDRDEWELPGGRMDPGETPEQALIREVGEEAGLAVAVDRHLGQWPLEVLPGRLVLITAYACHLLGATAPICSPEHGEVRFWPLAALDGLCLPEVYRQAIALART